MKKNIKKLIKKIKKTQIIEFGLIKPNYRKILILIIANVFLVTAIVINWYANPDIKQKTAYQEPYASKKNIKTEKAIMETVKGYPIEKMTTYLAEYDPKVVAFMIAIAKKESAWGKRKPVLNGEDCYNYWGFRMKNDKMGSGGHTCFDSPQEAVDAVAGRINELVYDEKLDTPKEMVVWKCGYGCQNEIKTGSEKKWIDDVNYYYRMMMEKI